MTSPHVPASSPPPLSLSLCVILSFSLSVSLSLFDMHMHVIAGSRTRTVTYLKKTQGSCAGLEFKASLEKSLNFTKLKKSLNCFGKRVEGLEKFGIHLSWKFQHDFVTWWLWELPAIVAIKRVEELLRPLIINKRHAWMLQIGVFFSSTVPVGLYAIEWSTGRRPRIIEWKGLKKPGIF